MAPLSLVTQGLEWYPNAYRIAKEIGKGDAKLGAGLLAAISPQMPWNLNIKRAKAVSFNRDWTGLTGDKCRKCEMILDGIDPYLILRGFKARAFYANILGFWEHVTVDTWMIQAFAPRSDYPSTANRTNRKGRALYNRVANQIRVQAKAAGYSPAEWQAVLWCHIRGGAN